MCFICDSRMVHSKATAATSVSLYDAVMVMRHYLGNLIQYHSDPQIKGQAEESAAIAKEWLKNLDDSCKQLVDDTVEESRIPSCATLVVVPDVMVRL